jgi:hypothetical protein
MIGGLWKRDWIRNKACVKLVEKYSGDI